MNPTARAVDSTSRSNFGKLLSAQLQGRSCSTIRIQRFEREGKIKEAVGDLVSAEEDFDGICHARWLEMSLLRVSQSTHLSQKPVAVSGRGSRKAEVEIKMSNLGQTRTHWTLVG